MLVRAVTPAGAYGLVFGFVSVGFNIGASVAPIIYGALMDNGMPRAFSCCLPPSASSASRP